MTQGTLTHPWLSGGSIDGLIRGAALPQSRCSCSWRSGRATLRPKMPTCSGDGPRDEKVVALTFDDGWSTPRCHKILEILVLEKVPATFFPNALYVRQHPEFWRRVAELGFPIGNHTVNHRDLTELTGAAVFKEINRDREMVEQITGVPMIRVMRPPFGMYDKRTLRQSARAGFPTILLWDVTASDTSRHSSERSMLKAATSGRNGSVVVLHCGPKATPRILRRIIKSYRARGFGFVTIPELPGNPRAESSAPSTMVGVTAACAARTGGGRGSVSAANRDRRGMFLRPRRAWVGSALAGAWDRRIRAGSGRPKRQRASERAPRTDRSNRTTSTALVFAGAPAPVTLSANGRVRSVRSAVARSRARIGADPRDTDELRLRKALLVLVCVLILPISLVWGAIYLAFGVTAGLIAWLYLLISVGAIAIFSRTRDTEAFLRVELLDILLAPTISMAFVGGFLPSGAVGLWGILAPLGALVFNGARSGVRWFIAFVALFLVSGIVGELAGGGSTLPPWFASTMIALNVTVAGTVVFGLLAQFVRQREEALAALHVEQDRAENLLLNILPRSIAERLKADAATIADQFAAASILFADVVDFTRMLDRLQPAEVVGLLDHLFTHFDLLAERYGVEKIKTIGDAYMVAAGVPTPRADHARVMALMALDMREAVR